ncbi:hypothetical protein N0V88_005991 [Collariella sp. IMI 366227]|nr:hypothetical protein N0V88_005991 [Collariella sp. IMI 366227]
MRVLTHPILFTEATEKIKYLLGLQADLTLLLAAEEAGPARGAGQGTAAAPLGNCAQRQQEIEERLSVVREMERQEVAEARGEVRSFVVAIYSEVRGLPSLFCFLFVRI